MNRAQLCSPPGEDWVKDEEKERLVYLAEKGYVVCGNSIAPGLAILITGQQAEGGEAEADH